MSVQILIGDVRDVLPTLPADSFDCCVTSPPYFGLRDYGVEGQIGLEATLDAYLETMVAVCREVRRLLKPSGTFWLNVGDSYAGSWGAQSRDHAGKHAPNVSALSANQVKAAGLRASKTGSLGRSPGLKPKDLMMVPARLAIALQADGWWLRDSIVWAKPNGMPGSQADRCTSSHESVFHLTKSADYWSDFDAIKTPPRESTLIRTAQDIQAQAGSHRANGGAKTNGPMKAMGGVSADKQRGHSRKHAGFNERWDAMERSEQMAQPAMMRNVWFIAPASYSSAHFATMPEELARRCILAGCSEGGSVFDPFGGAGTTGLVADRLRRDATLIEINPAYAEMARARIDCDAPLLASVPLPPSPSADSLCRGAGR